MPATYEALLKFAKVKNYHVEMTEGGNFIGWPLDCPGEKAWWAEGILVAFHMIGL